MIEKIVMKVEKKSQVSATMMLIKSSAQSTKRLVGTIKPCKHKLTVLKVQVVPVNQCCFLTKECRTIPCMPPVLKEDCAMKAWASGDSSIFGSRVPVASLVETE